MDEIRGSHAIFFFVCMRYVPKYQKWSGFLSFSIARSEKNEKNLTFGFQWVAKYIEGWLKTYTSYLVYSQIWLNLPKKDCQFVDIFLWMVGHCGSKSKFLLKEHTVIPRWEIHPLESSRIRDDKWRMHYPLASSLRHLDEHGAWGGKGCGAGITARVHVTASLKRWRLSAYV